LHLADSSLWENYFFFNLNAINDNNYCFFLDLVLIMDSKTAKQILIETEKFLTELPNISVIMSYGQKHKKVQILPYDISYVGINISEDIIVNKGACALLPDEFNHYVLCADTIADGNCLYNAAFCFLIKDDLLAIQEMLLNLVLREIKF